MKASLSTLNERPSSVTIALPTSRPKWALTSEAFEKLLASLGGDRESAGEHYLETRGKLVRFFEWRGCPFPEDHADETINRVAKRLVEGEEILNPDGYCFGVARLVLLEINKESNRQLQALSQLPSSTLAWNQSEESDQRIDRLQQCLQKLSPDDRELILQYYYGEKGVKVDCRRKLAERCGVPMNTLRMRALRIRENLRRCFENCEIECRSTCTNRSFVDSVRSGPRRTEETKLKSEGRFHNTWRRDFIKNPRLERDDEQLRGKTAAPGSSRLPGILTQLIGAPQ